MQKSSYDVIVCGSGPAGLSAALASCECGKSCLLLEKMPRPGVKLLASGGGRCNFSNLLSGEDFMKAFGRNGGFMRKALEVFSRDDLRHFLDQHHVPTFLEDGFHYFPKSGRASDLLNAFLHTAEKAGLELCCSCRVDAVKTRNGSVCGVRINDSEEIASRKVILACGGTAMPVLGGSALGLHLAEKVGHTIVKPLPAMAPLYCCEDWVKSLAGVSLSDASLSFRTGKTSVKSRGTLLFTHTGLSGM